MVGGDYLNKQRGFIYNYKSINKYFKSALLIDISDNLTFESYVRLYAKEFSKKELNQIIKTIQDNSKRNLAIQTYVATILSLLAAFFAIFLGTIIPPSMVFLDHILSDADRNAEEILDIVGRLKFIGKFISIFLEGYILYMGLSTIIILKRYFESQKLYKIINIIKDYQY